MIIQGHLLFPYIQDKKKRKQFKNRMYLHSRLYLPCPSPLSSLSFDDQKLHRVCIFNQKIKFASVNPTLVPSRGWAAAVSREVTVFLTRDPGLMILSNVLWLEFTLEVEGAPWGSWIWGALEPGAELRVTSARDTLGVPTPPPSAGGDRQPPPVLPTHLPQKAPPTPSQEQKGKGKNKAKKNQPRMKQKTQNPWNSRRFKASLSSLCSLAVFLAFIYIFIYIYISMYRYISLYM